MISVWLSCLALSLAAGGDNLTPAGDCEQVENGYAAGWSAGWARDGAAAIQVELMGEGAHAGQRCLHLKHTGQQDWSLNPDGRMAVRPGDIFEFDVWLRVVDGGVVTLCAAVQPPDGVDGPVDWVGGGRELHGPKPEWTEVRTRLVVSPGKAWMLPRLIGQGPVEAYVDDFTVRPLGNLETLRAKYAGPPQIRFTGRLLEVDLQPAAGTAGVTDRRTGRVWRWLPGATAVVPTGADAAAGGVDLRFLDVTRDAELAVRYEVVAP